jgi:hypothetical protein
MLEALLSHPLTFRLGWTLVHSLWLGLALAGLLGLVLLLVGMGRSRLRHALASLVLLLWLAAPVATFLLAAPSPTASRAPDAAAPVGITASPSDKVSPPEVQGRPLGLPAKIRP